MIKKIIKTFAWSLITYCGIAFCKMNPNIISWDFSDRAALFVSIMLFVTIYFSGGKDGKPV